MLQRIDQRVAVFIDTQNMYHSAKHLYSARVNFAALVDAAAAGRQVIRAIAYVAKSKTGEESAFFEALTQNGIELKIKDVQEFASGQKKADWDVGMTVDAICVSPKVDAVVLVTGDGDFVPLVQYLQTHGTRAEVVAFGESTNAKLREIADTFTDVSEEPDTYLIRPHGAMGRRSAPRIVREERVEEEMPAIEEVTDEEKPKTSRSPRPHAPEEGLGLRKIRVTY